MCSERINRIREEFSAVFSQRISGEVMHLRLNLILVQEDLQMINIEVRGCGTYGENEKQ